MVLLFMGESCTGKSSAAEALVKKWPADVYTGKDYIKLAKNEAEAWRLFTQMIEEKCTSEAQHLIYVVTETDKIEALLGIKGLTTIKFKCDLELIKSRFKNRMNGHLPEPVGKMLEKKHELWKTIGGNMELDTTDQEVDKIVDQIIEQIVVRA